VECALKACIAKQVQQHDFPDRKLTNDSYTHDLQKLLKASGLEDELYQEVASNQLLNTNWLTVKDWTVDSRYEHDKSEATVRSFYSAVTSRIDGILPWLKRRW
jgi:hypothetical protein